MDTYRISLTLLIGIIIAQQTCHITLLWNFHPKLFTGVIMKRKSYFDRNSVPGLAGPEPRVTVWPLVCPRSHRLWCNMNMSGETSWKSNGTTTE